MADRMSVNQQIQVGVEATHGTAVACSKLLKCFDWANAIEADISEFRATGHKITGEVIENAEWMSHTLGGTMDFNGMIYPLSGCLGAATPALVSPSTTVYTWPFAPPILGPAAPKTFTFQQGDVNIAHQDAFVLFQDWGYKATRKADVELNGVKAIGQAISTGVSLTATPTAIALAPMTGKMLKLYLDTTSGGLGTTQIPKPLSFEFAQTGIYGDVWFLTGNPSFDGYADLPPKSTGKIVLEADTNGITPLSYVQAGTRMYLRCAITGPIIDSGNALPALFTHDMAIEFGKPDPFSDVQGIFAVGYSFTLVEDSTWGFYQKVTIDNLIAAL